MAVADAKALCLKTPHCWAITYDGPLAPRASTMSNCRALSVA